MAMNLTTQASLLDTIKDIMSYKGSKATYQEIEDLAGMVMGDVWECTEVGKEGFYIYDGAAWKLLGSGGGGVPAGNYVTIDTEQTITGSKTFTQDIHADNKIYFGNGIIEGNLNGIAGLTLGTANGADNHKAIHIFPGGDGSLEMGTIGMGGLSLSTSGNGVISIRSNTDLVLGVGDTGRVEMDEHTRLEFKNALRVPSIDTHNYFIGNNSFGRLSATSFHIGDLIIDNLNDNGARIWSTEKPITTFTTGNIDIDTYTADGDITLYTLGKGSITIRSNSNFTLDVAGTINMSSHTISEFKRLLGIS